MMKFEYVSHAWEALPWRGIVNLAEGMKENDEREGGKALKTNEP
jgi:hypothetical protein